MILKRIILGSIFIIILFIVNTLYAQTDIIDKNKIIELEKTITENKKFYDTHINLLNKMEKQLKKDFENKKNELSNAQTKEFIQLKNNIDNATTKLNHFLWFIILGGSFGIFIGIKKFSEQKIIKILAKNFDIKAKNLSYLLKEVKTDYTLKQNKKILVVTPENENEEFIKNFFLDMDFPLEQEKKNGYVKFISFVKNQAPVTGFNLVLFNDDNNNTSQCMDEIETYLKSFDTKTVRFYFGSNRINYPNDKNIPRNIRNLTTFANARLQLYGNLMNALRFKV